MRRLEPALRTGASALGLEVSEPAVGRLLDYLELLLKWNRAYNLTAVREPEAMLTQHLLDSLAVLPPLQRHLAQCGAAPDGRRDLPPFSVLDVGSGAGLPGVVLAICCPGLQVDCVDTVAKKAAFITQTALTLGLPNLRGLHARVENLHGPYDLICARAFASLRDFTTWSGAALAPGGVWLALKGKHPAQELLELPPEIEMFHVEPLQVPGLDAQRCLLWLRQARALIPDERRNSPRRGPDPQADSRPDQAPGQVRRRLPR